MTTAMMMIMMVVMMMMIITIMMSECVVLCNGVCYQVVLMCWRANLAPQVFCY